MIFWASCETEDSMQAGAQSLSGRTRLTSKLNAVIDNPMRLFIAVFVIFLLVYGGSIFLIPKRYGRLIVGDGIYYYVYLRSAVLDGDLNFQNDYEIYQSFNVEDLLKKQEMLSRKTPTGMPANLFSVGPAVLWSPVFLLTHGLLSALGHFGDGYAFEYQAPIMLLSIVYGFIGIVLTYRVTAGMFSRFAAFVSLLGIWLATNVVYYMGISPSASHVLSLFASALFVYIWWRGRNARTKWGWMVWGLSAGLMTLVRWQDILIALLALLEWLKTIGDARRTTKPLYVPALVNGALFVAGLVVVFLPQMFAWQVLYGSPLTAPQGGGILSMAPSRDVECVVLDQTRAVFVVAYFVFGSHRIRAVVSQESFVGRGGDFDICGGIVHQQQRK